MTQERLWTLLAYDPDTGIFVWLVSLSPVAQVGSVAGSVYAGGSRYITIDRKRYLAHRLAWFYVHGEWPRDEIDHKNLNRDDNRLSNLRPANNQQQSANKRVGPNNKLGMKGVGISKPSKRTPQRYRARIRVDGRLIHLGYFSSPEEANRVYARAAEAHYGEFARSA